MAIELRTLELEKRARSARTFGNPRIRMSPYAKGPFTCSGMVGSAFRSAILSLRAHSLPCAHARLWRWGRVELPVQGLFADRVYERSRRFFVSRYEARADGLPVLARSVYLSPPTDRSAGRSSAYIALPGPRSGDRESVSLTRQRERKKWWQLSDRLSD